MKDGKTGAQAAAENLLLNCAGLVSGERLLILMEDAQEGHYAAELGSIVSNAARSCAIKTDLMTVPFKQEVFGLDPSVEAAMKHADCTIFFARLGDQIRFLDHAKNRRAIVCYALDEEMFSSTFGWAHHRAFSELKSGLDRMFALADRIRVTCPLGTKFEGPGSPELLDINTDVSVTRFPMSVMAPVPADGFAGQIAQRGFLTGTCSRFYQPYAAKLDDVLLVRFENNRITSFDGSQRDIATAEAHYSAVASRFNIDRTYVHSWHPGIHPGCAYTRPAAQNFERWCSGAFGNPRILHFHTCGAYAPGEISLNIVDPTIEIDGVHIWENGVLDPSRVEGGSEILAQYPCASYAFQNASRAIGF